MGHAPGTFGGLEVIVKSISALTNTKKGVEF